MVNLEVTYFKDVSTSKAKIFLQKIGAQIKIESQVSQKLTVAILPEKIMEIKEKIKKVFK